MKEALVLDNSTAHSNINSTKSIKLVFLPPNTTSVTQIMDEGLIISFKCHYHGHIIQHGLLKALERCRDFNWTVLNAIYGVKPHGARSPQPPPETVSATVALWPLPLPLRMLLTLMTTSPLPR